MSQVDYNSLITVPVILKIKSHTGKLVETNSKEQIADILSQYSRDNSNLIPILQEIQEMFGYLPEEAIERVAQFLKLSNSTVYAVSTFYTRFRLAPGGKRTIKVCHGPACHVRGEAHILSEVEKRLHIKPGETTADRRHSLEITACSGACALAPVIEIDDKVYGQMTTARVRHILADTEK